MKMGVVCVGVVRVSSLLKEELAWVTDKQLRINSSYTTKELKNKAVLSLKLKQYCMRCYVVLSNVF